MQTSIVGLSILWGLASFGVQGDFIESRDSVAPSWQAEVPTGERLRVSGEPQQEQSGWLLQVEDISQVSV